MEKFVVFLAVIPIVKGAIPGTFFWKPRLGLDLAIPTTEASGNVNLPTKENVHEGLVVLVDGYKVGVTVIALTAGLSSATPYPHLDPTRAFFYTQAYRWGLRYFSLIPFWIGGNSGNYCDTHKVWKRRFFYMDEMVPKWLRNIVPWVKKKDWKQEEDDMRRFKKYSESAFGKHHKYPKKIFEGYPSKVSETVEVFDPSWSTISRETRVN